MSSLNRKPSRKHASSPVETELGKMEYDTVVTSIREQTKKQKRKNSRLTDSERYLIAKYAAIHGATAAVKKFKKSHPHLKFGESTVRSLRDKYCEISKSSEHKAVITKDTAWTAGNNSYIWHNLRDKVSPDATYLWGED